MTHSTFAHFAARHTALWFAVLVFAALISSCRKDFSAEPSPGRLKFSKDTVYLDTVFTNIGSSTYNLKVYNTENYTISIPVIRLERGESSGYRLNVDGVPGKYFEDVEILPKDSIYIFVETTINYDEVTDPLYEDRILFDAGEKEQDVHLVTLVQDAHFLFPGRENGVIETVELEGFDEPVTGRYLTDDELTFTPEKPYVIYGYMVVGDADDNPKTLTMLPGTRVHFHAHSGLIVNAHSSLHILGELNGEGQPPSGVVLEGDRLEPDFAEVPGQWDFILLRNGSTGHIIRNATIKNAKAALVLEGMGDGVTPVLQLHNTQLYNHSVYGILAFYTHIYGTNVVTGNIGRSAFAGLLGGKYEFIHCTFTDYWTTGRELPVIWLSNNLRNAGGQVEAVGDLMQADFTNCIIYGSRNVEWALDRAEGAEFQFHFDSCMMKFYDPTNQYDDPLYDLSDTSYYQNVIIEGEPDFEDVSNNRFIIGEESACIGAASPPGTAAVPEDILGKPRANPADTGAYEHVVFEDEDE